MTRTWRILLVVEVLLCFSPAAWALFAFGLPALPALARPAAFDVGDVLSLFWLACGTGGLVGVVNVLRRLIHGSEFLRPRIGALALLLGAAAAAVLPVGLAIDSGMRLDTKLVLLGLFFLPPIASAAHLAYLARAYLFGREDEAPRAAVSGPAAARDSVARGRRSWKAAIAVTVVASLILDLVPRYGPPRFALARLSSDSMVWNFGWPLEVFVYDPNSGLYLALGAFVLLPAQLLVLAVLLIVAFWPSRLEPLAPVVDGSPHA